MLVSDLYGAGLRYHQIRTLNDTGRHVRIQRDVARIGGAPATDLGALVAMCRVTGGAASHRSSAFIDNMVSSPPSKPELSVGPKQSARRDAIIHRTSDLVSGDVHCVDGVRKTNATRTLLDLGAVVSSKMLENALEIALRERLTTFDKLVSRFFEVARRGRSGCGPLRPLLVDWDPSLAVADSALEVRLWQVLREGGAPLPVRQFPVVIDGEQYYLDLAYPERKLFSEGDGFGVHSARGAFEHDRARQNKLVLAGWKPLRYTWWQIVREPERVLAEILLAYEQAA